MRKIIFSDISMLSKSNKGRNKMIKKLLLIIFALLLISNITIFNAKAQEGDITMSDTTKVILETNQGDIEIQLFTSIAPKTCEDFLGLIEKGYYDGIIFHRVIKNFMIQGGDPTGTGRGGESLWGGKFKDEVTQKVTFDKKGLLAMANAGPNTNGSQFFITTVPTPWLNMKHTIFGEVISGYEAVDAIENTQVGRGDKPVEDQKIIRAYVVK